MHRSLNFVFWLEWRAKTLVIAIFESQKSGSLDQDYLGSFAMKIVEFVYVWWYFITVGCWKNRREVWEFQPNTWEFVFAWEHVWTWVFLKQIENKQPVQTSFRCVWANGNLSAEAAAVFFCPGMSKDIQTEMCVHPHIFHLKEAQKGQAWFK